MVKYLLLQLLIGIVINGACYVTATMAHNQRFYFNWVSVGGIVLILLGAIGFMGGSRRGDIMEAKMLHTSMTDIRNRRPSNGTGVKFALVLIGLTNIVLPAAVYSFVH